MTEYELATLFNETQADIVSGVSLYVSMLFGFIVASYLAAHHLNRAMMALALGLYTWFSFIFQVFSQREYRVYASLFQLIRAKGMAWHVATQTAAWVSDSIPTGALLFTFVAWLASIAFFFVCRERNRQVGGGAV
jgi:hypothetical protein